MHCIVQTQTYKINRTSQHEPVHELMAGMAWQTTHVAETHKNAFPITPPLRTAMLASSDLQLP